MLISDLVIAPLFTARSAFDKLSSLYGISALAAFFDQNWQRNIQGTRWGGGPSYWVVSVYVVLRAVARGRADRVGEGES